jgi:aquaporin-4
MGTTSIQDLKSGKFWLAIVAELLGTMFLVLVACGAAVNSGGNTVHIALAFAFSVATAVWFIAHVSGGHINPAVTFGFLVARRISVVRAVFYIISQTVGAVIGAGLLKVFTLDKNSTLGLTAPSDSDFGAGRTLGVELLITFVLVFTVFSCVDGLRGDIGGSVPLTIGVAIGMCHLWAVPITGSGMNPARSFGPAAICNIWKDHWAYWVGPMLGGAIAGLLYDFLFAVNATTTKVKGFFTRGYDNDNYDQHGSKPTVLNDSDSELKPR